MVMNAFSSLLYHTINPLHGTEKTLCHTCDPPVPETESTAFETLSHPPEKNSNLPTFQNFFFFFTKNIKNIRNSLDLII
jgi:hypothetical protein